VIDVIGVLTESTYPNRYWSDLKRKLIAEGATQPYEKIVRLKLRSPDGRLRVTDTADVETLLRIIQSIPSPKAEPVKLWLARVGARRVEEITQPTPPTIVARETAALERPSETAPALAWAEYHKHLATLYRRQAAYEEQLAEIDAWRGQVEGRLESHEEALRLLPEILERLGPELLSPEHQRTAQHLVKRLHEAGGFAYATIYADLGDHFHVAKYDQIPEARWMELTAWFRTRIEAAERRRR
jgi:hypothetical protein